MSEWERPGQSDDWYTPPCIFDALRCVFDLDVAAPIVGGCVPAHNRLTEKGLETPWQGFVWMNPPFGGRNGLAPWLRKFFDHGNGIALTPDRTSAPWFVESWPRADTVLFTHGKVRFLRPDGSEGKSPGSGTALWASGSRACFALRRAQRRGLGTCVRVTK